PQPKCGEKSAGDIVVADVRLEAGVREPIPKLARQHGRAMSSAGASETNRQIAFTFVLVERKQKLEQACDFVDKTPRLRLREHVFPYALVEPGQRTQLGNEERVRNKANVEHEVEPHRMAILVTERH